MSTSASTSNPVLTTPTKQGRSSTQSLRAKISRSFPSDIPRLSTISTNSSAQNAPSFASAPSSSSSPPLVPPAITPPPFPSPSLYTSCYCEENVYHLTSYLLSHLPSSSLWQVHVGFISNSNRTVLLYSQSASQLPDAGWPVIWDYHVVAVVTFAGKQSWVYDFDSTLSEAGNRAVPWDEYNSQTFRPERMVREELKANFRCVAGKDFLDWFASDRRHMLVEDEEGGRWSAKPPSWERVVGEEARREGVVNNLMDRYVDMRWDQQGDMDEASRGRYGRVWDWETWLESGCLPRTSHATIVDRQSSTPSAQGKDASVQETSKKGGRIVSPLFPAYLHASQQHRSQLPPPLTPTSTITSFSSPMPR